MPPSLCSCNLPAVSFFMLRPMLSKKQTCAPPMPWDASIRLLLPLLGTERLECIASGGQYTRVDKTIRVARVDASTQFLDVCVNPWMATERLNCSGCWKCLRTQLTLAVLGELDRYDKVFDVGLYRRLEKY